MKSCHTVRFPQSEVDREEQGIKLLKSFQECLRTSDFLKEMKSYPNQNPLQRFSVGERYRGTPRVHAWHPARVRTPAPTRVSPTRVAPACASHSHGVPIPMHARLSPTRACMPQAHASPTVRVSFGAFSPVC